MPYILVVLLFALMVFLVYCYLTVPGRRAKLLSNNQQVSVNIGVKENKNLLQTFFMCGLLLGCAGAIFGSNNMVSPQAGLSTADTLFSNIIPAHMGIFAGAVSVDAIGVVLAALGMAILNCGLSCIGLGSGGWQQIIVGCFTLGFYSLTAQWPRWKEMRRRRARVKENGHAYLLRFLVSGFYGPILTKECLHFSGTVCVLLIWQIKTGKYDGDKPLLCRNNLLMVYWDKTRRCSYVLEFGRSGFLL